MPKNMATFPIMHIPLEFYCINYFAVFPI